MRPKYDFFIAYAASDLDVAERLYALLSRAYRVFFAPKSLKPGELWNKAIPAAQKRSRVLVILVSRSTENAFFEQEEVVQGIELCRKEPLDYRLVPLFLAGRIHRLPVPYGLTQVNGIYCPDASHLRTAARELRRALRAMDDAEEALLYEGATARTDIEIVLSRLASFVTRSKEHLSIIFADLDRFGALNRGFGKEAGDTVIQTVDGLMLRHFDGEFVERLREDEYIACLRDTKFTVAFDQAEQLRQSIAEFDWSPISADIHVSLSIGVARTTSVEAAYDTLLRAMQGCQLAKREGGNRVKAGPLALPKNASRRVEDYSS